MHGTMVASSPLLQFKHSKGFLLLSRKCSANVYLKLSESYNIYIWKITRIREEFVVDTDNKATPTYRMKHAGLEATIQLPGTIQINNL